MIPETIYGLLRRGVEEWPDRDLVVLPDGGTWTWTQALEEAASAANVLRARGVGPGDVVMILLPNGTGWLRAWWGATLLGAVTAPVNPAFRGRLLSDLCDRVAPKVIATAGEFAERVEGAHRDAILDPSDLSGGERTVEPLADPPQPWDTHCLLMTSGTTGPSKASITTNRAICFFGAWLVEDCGVGPDDTFLADMPWFHLSAFGPVVQTLRVGGRFAVREAPAMTSYWQTARELGTTYAVAPGTVAAFLESRPPSDDDRDHPMRFVVCSPLPADIDGFVKRFGLQGMCTAYGSTESNIPLVQTLGTTVRPGSCGRARPGFTVRLVDEHDAEVPVGEIGELVIRAEPWMLSMGYVGDPEGTVRAWRNGWFHTGDALRSDEDGYLYFHDRYKDALRRRGENISSFEVERDVLAYPGVAEAACVAAPGEFGGDDEVKVFVVAAPGVTLDFEDMLQFLADRMTYFMVPRFFELATELPKTPSLRVRKHELRALGNTDATWDREAHGYRMTRSGLERS